MSKAGELVREERTSSKLLERSLIDSRLPPSFCKGPLAPLVRAFKLTLDLKLVLADTLVELAAEGALRRDGRRRELSLGLTEPNAPMLCCSLTEDDDTDPVTELAEEATDACLR